MTPTLSQRPVEARSSVAQLHVGRRRSKWQVAAAATVVVVCATAAAVTYAQATKQVGIVVASTPMPAGTVISAADLRVGHVVAGSGVTGVAPSAVSTLVGRQLAEPVAAGEVMVQTMLAHTPAVPSGDEVVGVVFGAHQVPVGPLVVGDTLSLVATATPVGMGGAGLPGSVVVSRALVVAVGATPTTPGTQAAAAVSVAVPAKSASKVAAYAANKALAVVLVKGPAR